jgi:hypothetical protein
MAFEFATEEERKKFNQGTQDALGILFDGDDAIKRAVSYSDENGIVMPPINPDEYVNLGITDDQGNVTEKGLLIYNLKEAGIFDDDLKLTTKGRAYTIPQEELLQDKRLLEEFEIARQDGLYGMRQSFSFEDAGEAVAGMVSDAAKGIGKGLKRDSAVLFDWLTNGAILSPKYREELASEGAVFEIALREGFRENTQLLAQMGKIGIVKAESAFAPAQNEQHDQQERMALASARQDLEYTKYVQQNQKLGELADQLELTIGPDFINSLYGYETPSAVQQVEIARETLGESEVEQIAKEGQAVAEFAGPENLASVGVGAVVGAGRSVTTRLALSSQRLMSEYTTLTAGIAKTQAQIVDVTNKAAKAQRFSGMASQAAKGLRNQFDEVGDQLLLKRAREADELATRQGSLAAKLGDDITPLLDELAALTAQAKKMSNVPTSIAKSYAATQELGARIFKEGPFRFAGATMEVIGKSLTAVDDTFSTMAQRSGIGAVYNTLNSGIGIAGIAGTSAVLGPIPAYVAGVKTVLNSGKIIERLGNTFRILGKEMVRARGQVPFWRRVANVPNISSAHRALAHGLDHLKVASLYGGTKTFAKGTIASFPIDLGFEYLAAGAEFNQSVVNQALAESSVLGGSSAALGGLFKGSNKRFRELSAGDELNFIRDLTPEQKSVFFSASPTMRRAISTFSAVFPNSDVRVVRSGGDGGYHDQGKIVIDLDSKNPLKELLGHEVMHHVSYVNQMDQGIAALLIGDGEFGGILRSPDGTLDEGFRKFSDEYKRRMAVQYERNGQQAPSLSLDYLANEYFADVVGRRLFESAVSGELGKAAARTTIERKIAGFIDGILPKAPIVKNFHARIGGQFDASGNMVMGSGLLSEGLKDLPEIRNMMKNMVTTAAGYSMGQFKPIGITDKSSRVSVPINKNDKPMINLVGPVLFKGEYVNGVWQNDLDKNGDPIPISSKFDSERASSGFVVADAVAKNSDGTEANGQMRLKDGEVSDGWMPQYAIKALKDAGILNPVQIRIIQNINNAIKNFDGKRFSIIYHAALGKSKKGKIRYESLEATIRDVVPMGFKISNKGNILVSLMDVRRLNANVDKLIDSKRGLSLYGRNRNAFMQDLGAVMDIWNGSGSTDSYFQSKYPSDWQRRKNFVNLAFGLSSRAQTMIDPNTGRIPNPLFLEDNIKGNSVFATYRADRMSRATNMSGEKPNMPVQYASVVGNLMPNGLPTLDENGNPVAQKFYDKSIQQDSGQRLMPENLDADYLAAVERGDMETVQRIVDEATMDVELLNPPKLPNDLAEAWEYGKQAQGLSDRDTAEKTPSWVFDFGFETSEFFEAGRRGESPEYVVGFRFGNLPERGRSTNWADNTAEPGVSLAYAHRRPEQETNPMTMIGVGLRKKVLLGGWAFPKSRWGSDGEIVILNPNQIKSADPITRDDQGNVIPLSQRFDVTSSDIRFMPDNFIGENSDYSTPPSDDAAKNALSSSKKQFFGESVRSIGEGFPVGVRIDIPAFLDKGVYVQTVHEKATPGDVGDRIGYDTHVRLKNGVRFFVKEGSESIKRGAMAIKEGRANKHPIATVEGAFSKDRSIPQDINEWTPVGMDPKKHSYFYDKRTGDPVIGGSESYSVNNTVFVKDPVYGKRQDFRYMPEVDLNKLPENVIVPDDIDVGKEVSKGRNSILKEGDSIGTFRYLPEGFIEKFAITDQDREYLKGKSGFAFVSDWADSERKYVTKNGREIDVMYGGIGYPFIPEMQGKAAWASTRGGKIISAVAKKIESTDGVGLIVLGGKESSASSRAFSIAFTEELLDAVDNGTDVVLLNDAIKKAFIDYNVFLKSKGKKKQLPIAESITDWSNSFGGLTFEDRAALVKRIGSHNNKKSLGILSWNDVLKKYNIQNKDYAPGQIVGIVEFSKKAAMSAEEAEVPYHPSYEAVFPGRNIGTIDQKLMIGDFFKDFFEQEKTKPASYTRKVQTKMPVFTIGEGSAYLPKSTKK